MSDQQLGFYPFRGPDASCTHRKSYLVHRPNVKPPECVRRSVVDGRKLRPSASGSTVAASLETEV